MGEINVITYKDRIEWNKILDTMDDKDIYFTPEYCKIYEDNGDGEARLYKYEDDNVTIIYPFLYREINKLNKFSNLQTKVYDISTPYGYGGPLIKRKSKNNIESSIDNFSEEFHKYCISGNVISEFIRFHPLLKNQSEFENIYRIKLHNKTVLNDVDKGIEEIWNKEFKKNNRNAIRKSRKNGIEIFMCGTDNSNYNEVMNQFKQLYYSTMDKNNASDYYYFDKKYFSNFSKLLDCNHKLFYAVYKNKIIAASLVMFMDKYVHMHLSASNKEYIELSPNNPMDYEIIKWANYTGYKFVHHGGGTSSDPDDRLLKYKTSFSKSTSDFYLGYKIHNKEIYKELCNLNENVNINDTNDIYNYEDKSYFPLYRYGL